VTIALAARPLRRLGVLATAGLTFSACGSSAAPATTEFPVTSAEGRFRAVFPAKPDTGVTEADAEGGKRKVTSMLAAKGSDDFGITWSDFPKSFLASGPTAVLEGVRDKVMADAKATLQSSEEITLNGHPGLKVAANVPEGVTKGDYQVRFYLVGARIYQVLVIRNDAKADDTAVLDFFDSFTLTGS
jgi:hypothetical protein